MFQLSRSVFLLLIKLVPTFCSSSKSSIDQFIRNPQTFSDGRYCMLKCCRPIGLCQLHKLLVCFLKYPTNGWNIMGLFCSISNTNTSIWLVIRSKEIEGSKIKTTNKRKHMTNSHPKSSEDLLLFSVFQLLMRWCKLQPPAHRELLRFSSFESLSTNNIVFIALTFLLKKKLKSIIVSNFKYVIYLHCLHVESSAFPSYKNQKYSKNIYYSTHSLSLVFHITLFLKHNTQL